MSIAKEYFRDRVQELYGIPIPPLPEPEIPIKTPHVERMPRAQDYPLQFAKDALRGAVCDLTSQPYELLSIVDVPPNQPGDLGVALHRVAAAMRTSPKDLAEGLEASINFRRPAGLGFVTRVFAAGGYLNIELDAENFATATVGSVEAMGDRYGETNVGGGQTVVIDCSSPNVAKHFSVGHLRSTVIGESLARIYRAVGWRVVRDNHIGDWGTQFALLAVAYDRWGSQIPNSDSVSGLQELYVRINKEIEQEKAQSTTHESVLESQAKSWFRALESGDGSAVAFLRWATDISLREFRRIYDLLGSPTYEYLLGESFYIPMLANVVDAFARKNLTAKTDKGVTVVDFGTDAKLNPLAILKPDGTSLYSVRDLATLVARTAWFHPARILYVVGGDQIEYFRQVFEAFSRFTDGSGPQTEHVWFGMITLPEGKMSTRAGRVVLLEDVLNEAIRRAKEKILSKSKLESHEISAVARQVGIGAVIYMDLGQGRQRGIEFDWEKALSLEANSGPYIQYTNARAQSILRRARAERMRVDTRMPVQSSLPSEKYLVTQLAKFPESVRRAAEENQPSVVSEALYRAAEAFNHFYTEASVLSEPDRSVRNSRLRLTAAASQVIRNGLYLLGIEAPERM